MLRACRPSVARSYPLYVKGSAGRSYAVRKEMVAEHGLSEIFSETYYLHGDMTPAKKQRYPLNRRLGGLQSLSELLNKLWGGIVLIHIDKFASIFKLFV